MGKVITTELEDWETSISGLKKESEKRENKVQHEMLDFGECGFLFETYDEIKKNTMEKTTPQNYLIQV